MCHLTRGALAGRCGRRASTRRWTPHGEVPYLIESSPIDPFNQVLVNAQALSAGTIDSGTWSTNGPRDGGERGAHGGRGRLYRLADSALVRDGTLTTKVSPGLDDHHAGRSHGTGADPGLGHRFRIDRCRGRRGDGRQVRPRRWSWATTAQLVATASLDGVLASGTGGSVTVSGVPAGTSTAVYYAPVRAWNSSDPSERSRASGIRRSVDLRTSTSGSIALTIN